jgi:hypothetical protein
MFSISFCTSIIIKCSNFAYTNVDTDFVVLSAWK